MTRWPGVVSLGGTEWRVGRVAPAPLWQSDDIHAVQEWLPATVPGNLEGDLLDLGRIPDPTVGTQNEEGRWVEQFDWWYRRTIDVPLGGQRAHVVLHGVDYYSAVYANGVLLGQHEGMFSEQTYDVTESLCESGGALELAVRLWGAHALPRRTLSLWQRLAEPALHLVSGDADMFPARIRTTKCQMSFGWDFAPRLPTIGIWDEVELAISGPTFIADLWAMATPRGGDADVTVRLRLDSSIAGPAQIVLRVQGVNFPDAPRQFVFDIDLASGMQDRQIAFTLPAARLWQPWDRGDPNLYDLTIEIKPAGADAPSSASTTFGVRSVELVQRPAAGRAWALIINGNKEFVRGVNWVPASVLPGRVRFEDYAALLDMARAANANMLRVWGGGLREKRDFYHQCDRAGLLVWQEFPFACPNLSRYPTDATFLSLAQQEATSIVRSLRNHPSVVLWCGGNEFGPSKNKPLVQRLEHAARENDGTRPFLPASPSAGDSHNWQVWHHYAPINHYVKEDSPLVSEFGLQSVPDVPSLETFMPGKELWPAGTSWLYHNAEMEKLLRYGGVFPLLSDFVRATQLAQARGVQIMVEHMRRRKPASGGVLVWQLNEPWPSICWSLVGYDRRPKLAYHMLRRVFNPLLVSVEYTFKRYKPADAVDLRLWVVNDWADSPSPHPSPWPGEGGSEADCTLHLSLNGRDVHDQKVHIRGDSSDMVGKVNIRLPQEPAPWLLRAELRCGEDVLAVNEYDLATSTRAACQWRIACSRCLAAGC